MIKIYEAKWGYNKAWIDVRHVLGSMRKKGGNLIVQVENGILSNPNSLMGVIKELRITYSYNGILYEVKVQEKHPQTYSKGR